MCVWGGKLEKLQGEDGIRVGPGEEEALCWTPSAQRRGYLQSLPTPHSLALQQHPPHSQEAPLELTYLCSEAESASLRGAQCPTLHPQT